MKKYFIMVFFLILLSCNEKKIEPQLSNEHVEGEIPAHESWGSKIIFSDDGKTKAILYSTHLKKYELEKVTLLDSIRIDFYNPQQQKVSTLTSLKGRVDDKTQNMFAIDSVVAVNDSGTVLKTSELMWRNNDQKIVSDKFVTIKSTKELIEGYGFESDQDLHNYVIYNVTYSTTVSGEEKK